MTEPSRTHQELWEENGVLKQKIKELEHAEAERERVEEALRKSEANYRQLFDNSPTAIYQIDFRSGKFLKANDVICDYLGCSQEEITSRTPYDIMTDESKQLLLERLIKMNSGEKVSENPEYEVVDRNGKRRWLQLNSKNIYDAEGRVIGADVVAHEITDRKRAEEALKKSEEMLRLITENMSDMVRVTDLQGINLYVSPSHFKGLGYRQEDRYGKPGLDIVHPGDVQRVIEAFSAGLTRRQPVKVEYRVKHADGRYLWLETIGDLMRDEQGQATAIVMSSRDITDRKQTEEENLRLVERLQRAEKMEALGTLAGGVAHDLNNVLGIVVGYSELLLAEVDGSSPIRPHLLNIVSGGESAAAIVQDMLTMTRRGVSSRRVLNLTTMILEDQYSPEFKTLWTYHPAVRLDIDLEPNLLNVSGSPVHISKTLFNLVSNACEAMPKGGLLTIRTANQYIDRPIQGYEEVQEGDYVVLSVSDTGEGIPATDLKRIFEPFYTKKVMGRSGTGLGLAVVWGTVQDHRGYINVQSEEGKGSTFTLYFPVTREEVQTDRVAIPIAEYRGHGESILIVDDVKGQRDLAAAMLEKLNYRVTSVASGEAAVEYLRTNEADLVILDMIMEPGIDGFETYRQISETRPGQKAIIVSGYAETERVSMVQSLGAGAFIRKPYIGERLGLAVRQELNRKKDPPSGR